MVTKNFFLLSFSGIIIGTLLCLGIIATKQVRPVSVNLNELRDSFGHLNKAMVLLKAPVKTPKAIKTTSKSKISPPPVLKVPKMPTPKMKDFVVQVPPISSKIFIKPVRPRLEQNRHKEASELNDRELVDSLDKFKEEKVRSEGKASSLKGSIPSTPRPRLKDFVIEELQLPPQDHLAWQPPTTTAKKIRQPRELNDKELIEHHGFAAEDFPRTTWSQFFQKLDLEKKFAQWNDYPKAGPPPVQVAMHPAIPTKNESEDLLENFKNDEQSPTTLLLEAKVKQNVKESEPSFYQYDKTEQRVSMVQSSQDRKLLLDDVGPRNSGTPAALEPEATALPSSPSQEIVIVGGNSSISSNVQKTIERVMEEKKNVAPKAKPARDYPLVSSQKPQLLKAATTTSSPSLEQSRTTVTTFAASLDSQRGNKLINFQFVPDYDKGETFNDDHGGELVFTDRLSKGQSLLRGSISKYGLMRTKVEVPLGGEGINLAIPMITQESLDAFTEKYKLDRPGGFLLVDLGEELSDVDIDQEYQNRFFMDENFKVVNSEKDYRFVLYSGVEGGNVIIRYLLASGQVAQKIAHIVPDEVLYESGHLSAPAVEKFSLLERNALGARPSELDIQAQKISVFNTDIRPTKEALNRFEVEFPPQPLGMRHFLELNHLGGSLFVGLEENKDLEVPSQDFIDNIFKVHGLHDFDKQCLVQLNFSKKIQDFLVDGDTGHGAMSFRKTFLEKDGVFSEEASEISDKAFLIGEFSGVFNIKIVYQDDTTKYLQSFCSESTYLVESL